MPSASAATHGYDERAASPAGTRRRRRGAALLCIATALVLVAALAFVTFRPAFVLGVEGGALERSIGGGLLGGEGCRDLGHGAWNCSHYDRELSGSVRYRVTVDSLGCWDAVRIANWAEPSPKRLSGCLTIADYLLG